MSKLLDYTGLQYYHGKVQAEISQLGLEVNGVNIDESWSALSPNPTTFTIPISAEVGTVLKIKAYNTGANASTISIDSRDSSNTKIEDILASTSVAGGASTQDITYIVRSGMASIRMACISSRSTYRITVVGDDGLVKHLNKVSSSLGALTAEVGSETMSFDVVSGKSIPQGKYSIPCNIITGKTYVLAASGPFSEISCYGITEGGTTVSIGSFLPSRTLTFTAAQDFTKVTIYVASGNATGSGTGTFSISLSNNVEQRLDVLEEAADDSTTIFYGEHRVTANFFDTVVPFHAKAGNRVSFIVRANPSTFKEKAQGTALAGIRALTGIYLNYGETTYARLASGINGTINLWHTFITPHDLDSLKIYCVMSNDLNDGETPLLSAEVRVGDANLPIPDYYFADNYLQNKIKRIGEIVQNIDGDAFAFTTDEHWEYNRRFTPSILQHLSQRAFFSKHISTGDHCQVMALGTTSSDGEDDNLNRYVLDFVEHYATSSGKPFLSAIGNHEYLTEYYTAGRLSGVDLHNWVRNSHLMKNTGIVYGSREKLYYYFDDTEKNIRYIFLSSFTPEQNAGGTQTSAVSDYDNTQLSWLTNTALNVQNGWSVIVVTHNIFNWTGSDPVTITFSEKHKQFLSALLANNDDGKIIAVLTGHTHRDGLFLVKDSDLNSNTGNSLYVITSQCDANGFDWDAERITQYRETGTINEVAFDFVCFDRGKKMLDFIRIGAPANIAYQHEGTLEERIIRYEMESVTAGNTKSLSPVIDGTITWSSSDSSVATVSSGVVTGVGSGNCSIIATNEDNQIELFNIKVS